MYYQLMTEPYCMLATDIDNLTLTQFLLYFAKEEDVKGTREISPTELKRMLQKNSKSVMTREEFLRRGEEIRKEKKKLFQERRQKRIDDAQGGKRK